MIRIRTMIRVVSKHRTKSLPPRIIESNAIEIPLETRSVPLAQALEGGHHGGTIRPRKDGSIHADADKPTAIGSAFAIDSVAASALHCQCFRRRGRGLAVVEWSCFSCKFGIGTIIVFHNDIVGASHQELHQHGQHSGPGYTYIIQKERMSEKEIVPDSQLVCQSVSQRSFCDFRSGQ